MESDLRQAPHTLQDFERRPVEALAAALGLDDAVPVRVARNTGSNGLRIRLHDG